MWHCSSRLVGDEDTADRQGSAAGVVGTAEAVGLAGNLGRSRPSGGSRHATSVAYLCFAEGTTRYYLLEAVASWRE